MTDEHNHNFASIILAAGKGTRMRSRLPKVMHSLAGKPMIRHVVANVAALNPAKTVIVIAPGMESVKEAALAENPACRFALQDAQQGTGHAVRCAEPELAHFDGTVMILYGDVPLLTTHTMHRLIHAMESADIAVIGMEMQNPAGYGRMIVDSTGQLEEIIEDKDASDEQKRITLCNSGIMAVRGKHLFSLLSKLTTTNAAGEYYLTDIVAHADAAGLHCHVLLADGSELMGVNSRLHLAEAEALLQWRLRARAMEQGATLIDPATVYFSMDTALAPDVIVHPQVVFGAGVEVEEGAEIRSFSHIEGAKVQRGAVVGPFARLRHGTTVGEGAHVGNFVELKQTSLGKGAKANHLSYVGDSVVGAGANIGAGTITCNYDGFHKYKTIIGEGAFIGSNTALVAPVSVGSFAIVGAGSVITKDVEEGALAVTRPEQVNKTGKAKEIRARKKS